MKIGIDLDGVIFDTVRHFRYYSEMADIENFGLDNVLDAKKIRFQDRYNWSDEFCKKFYSDVLHKIETTSGFLPGAVDIIKYLKSKGHKLYIISARGIFNEDEIDISKNLLKEASIDIFDEYIFKAEDKAKIIKEKKIDLMIEDTVEICNNIKDLCKVIYLKSSGSYEADEHENITTLYSWGEIYRYFKKIEVNKL